MYVWRRPRAVRVGSGLNFVPSMLVALVRPHCTQWLVIIKGSPKYSRNWVKLGIRSAGMHAIRFADGFFIKGAKTRMYFGRILRCPFKTAEMSCMTQIPRMQSDLAHADGASKTIEEDPRTSLGRAQRAIARVLVNKHGIHARAIIKKLGWKVSEVTIRKAAANRYAVRDKEDEDKGYLPSNFETIVSEIMASDEGSAISVKTKSATKSRRAVPVSAPRVNAHAVQDDHCSQHGFLHAFVKHYGLDADGSPWFEFLATAGCNESNLRQMSIFAPAVIKEFIDTNCPGTTVAARLVFTQALQGLAMSF
ncbi:hypothetical protein C8R43DRAFT_952861 [Mycena crocata]|nr:hypothetical protein C8R43DRAFT_952861 [Mycena crocata]